MIVEERLRETLQRRVEVVDQSVRAPEGWTAITRRIEHRQRRARTVSLSLVAGLSLVTVLVAVVMATVADTGPSDQQVATGGPSAATGPTTSFAFSAPQTALDGSVIPPNPTQSGPISAAPGGEGGPGGAAGDDGRPESAGSGAAPAAAGASTNRAVTPIWPETQSEGTTLSAAVAAGHQPWRNDPVATASAYLSARGLPEPAVTERAPVGDAGQVRYTAGGVGGWVSVARSNPDAPYVVEGATSDRIVRIRAARQDGKLTVNVIASAPGTIVVRTRRPGASAGDISSRPVVAGQEVSLVVVGPDGQDLIVEIRHQGDDGTVGLAETFLPAAADQWSYEALYGGSLIRTGGLGVIGIDTDLASAERAAGVEMTYQRGEYCTSLAPVDQPEGVSFISTRGTDRVDVITVSAPSVHTASGIGVGSSVDDVRQAYPGIEERLTGDAGRLVLGPTGEGDEAFETVFGIADGEVNVVWIGHAGLGNTDELCA